jgi:hypothetical protein
MPSKHFLIGFSVLAGLAACASGLFVARPVRQTSKGGLAGGEEGAGRAHDLAAFKAMLEQLPQVTLEIEVLGEDDVPIEGAAISVEGGNEATGRLASSATTDRSGKASVTLPALGSLRIKVEKDGAIVDRRPFDPALPVHRMRVFLGRPGRVVFRVSDKAGSPLVGARIYLDGSGPEGKTAGDGELVLDAILADEHHATVKASRWVRTRQGFVLRPDRKVVLSYALEPAGALDLACQCGDGPCGGARVELLGAFVDPADPHSNIEDSADQGERADEKGRVFRDDLPGRTILIAGLHKQRTADERRGEMKVKLIPGRTHKAVLRFEKTGNFAAWAEGTIRTHDGKLAAGARVHAMCSRPEKRLYAEGETKTDESGHFRIENLSPAPCDLRAWPARPDCPPGLGCAGTPAATSLRTVAPARVDIRLRDPKAKRPPGESDHNYDQP